MPIPHTLPATYGRGEADVSHSSAEWGEGKVWFEDVQLQVKKAEIEQFRECGVVSKTLHKMLEVFTAPPVRREHVLKDWCKNCNKCTVCFETGGKTFIETEQIAAFKARIW